MPKRKDNLGGELDAEIRVRVPRELRDAALAKAQSMEYPTDLSAVVRVLLTRWVAGRKSSGRRRRGA